MKKLLFIVLAVFMSACSSSDDNGCNDKSALVGKWELTKQEGYEISGENKEEWNKSDDFDATYVFNCDNTGKYTCYEHSDEEYSSTAFIKWEYNTTGRTLAVEYVDTGDMHIYSVENISSSVLVLVTHKIQPEYSYEYYNKETYTKK